jgi:hypothetical protein
VGPALSVLTTRAEAALINPARATTAREKSIANKKAVELKVEFNSEKVEQIVK